MSKSKFGPLRPAAYIPAAVISLATLAGAVRAEEPARAAVPPELMERLRAQVGRAGGLTAESVALRAARTSTEKRARRADVAVAAAEVERADTGYYPRLSVLARYTRLSPIDPPTLGPANGSLVGTPATAPGPLPAGAPLVAIPASSLSFPVVLDQFLVQAGAVIPLSDYFLRIGQARDAAVLGREAAEHTEAAADSAVRAQAKLTYYSWARARLQRAVTQESVEQARHHLEVTIAARDAGRLPDVDVFRAKSLLSSAELLNERTKNAALLGEERLRTLLHDPSGPPYEVGDDLLAPMGPLDDLDPGALYAEAIASRPDLRALSRSGDALRRQRDASSAGNLPRLDAFGNAYLANPSPRVFPQKEEWRATWDVGVQLSFSPNDLASTASANHAIDARQRKLDADRAALADAVRDEIAGAVLAYREAGVARETAERGLEAAEEAYRVRQNLFDLGRGTSVELTDAEAEVLRARLEMIQASVDARVAKVRLEHAVGRDRTPR